MSRSLKRKVPSAPSPPPKSPHRSSATYRSRFPIEMHTSLSPFIVNDVLGVMLEYAKLAPSHCFDMDFAHDDFMKCKCVYSRRPFDHIDSTVSHDERWKLAAINITRLPDTECSFKFTMRGRLCWCSFGFTDASKPASWFKRSPKHAPAKQGCQWIISTQDALDKCFYANTNTFELTLTTAGDFMLNVNDKGVYRAGGDDRFAKATMRPFICLRDATFTFTEIQLCT